MGVALRMGTAAFLSPNTGAISGTLTGASGSAAPVHRVVVAEAHSYAVHGHAYTDLSGHYSIAHLNKALRYHVIFEDYDGGVQYDHLILSRVSPG